MSATSSLPRIRVAGRLAAAVLLDYVALNRQGRGLLDGLILSAAIQSNLSPLMRDPDLQLAYAAPADPAPDDVRRPVTVHAIAASLRVPYETVRRRMKIMTDDGLCRVVAEGVYVPQTFFSTPERLAAAQGFYPRLRDLYYQLSDLDALDDFSRAPPAAGEPPIRICMRAYNEYFLRIVDLLTQRFDDLIPGLILLTILRANTARLSNDEQGGEGLEAADFPPDDRRVPVSILSLAAQLGVPRETIRRRLNSLLSARRCVRGRAGVIIPAETLAQPEWTELMLENVGQLNRLFASLAALGVLALWDTERTPELSAGSASA